MLRPIHFFFFVSQRRFFEFTQLFSFRFRQTESLKNHAIQDRAFDVLDELSALVGREDRFVHKKSPKAKARMQELHAGMSRMN